MDGWRRRLSSKEGPSSYVNPPPCNAWLCISIRPTLLFFFKHMRCIISRHILQSGGCQCVVAMATQSVLTPGYPLPSFLHTPLVPPSVPANRMEKHKAWEKQFGRSDNDGGVWGGERTLVFCSYTYLSSSVRVACLLPLSLAPSLAVKASVEISKGHCEGRRSPTHCYTN